jgi:hypothetical protein
VGGFLIASVYAAGMLRGRRDRYHDLGFIIAFTVGAIATPIQIGIRDGRTGPGLGAPGPATDRSADQHRSFVLGHHGWPRHAAFPAVGVVRGVVDLQAGDAADQVVSAAAVLGQRR